MTIKTVTCPTCQKEFSVSLKEYNRKIRQNSLKFYCGRSCYFQARTICTTVERSCSFCGKSFESTSRKKHQTCCSVSCARRLAQTRVDHDALSRKMKRLYREGKITVPIQRGAQSKRSKNEILFYKLCKDRFSDTIHNVPMFGRWDADVIIPSLRIAVMWNGVWHRRQITKEHDVQRVQERDRIKIEEIKRCGYTPIVIDDDGAYNENFVREEFSKFCGSVARRVKAASS